MNSGDRAGIGDNAYEVTGCIALSDFGLSSLEVTPLLATRRPVE